MARLHQWDERKRRSNIAKHGIDFARIPDAFDFSLAMVGPSRLDRYVAIGPMDGYVVTVVFALLGREAISLISARPASRRERQAYDRRQAEERD